MLPSENATEIAVSPGADVVSTCALARAVPMGKPSCNTGSLLSATSNTEESFHALHERLYGVRFHVPVELVALRVVATGATPPVDEDANVTAGIPVADAVISHEPAYFDGEWRDIPHLDRAKLAVGVRVDGPAIIRQYDTTTVLLPRHYAEVDAHGNLLIWPVDERN